MIHDQLFKWLFIAIVVSAFFMSGYFRLKARQSGEVIPRVREGKLSLTMRLLFAAPLYLSFLAYMVNPNWMWWSSVPLPRWLRWLGSAVALGMLPLLYRTLSSLGRNISETVFTKEHHMLVTQGPYRWVRHPLYTTATTAFISLGILAANWFIIAVAILIIVCITLIVIPREEAELAQKFGDEYREYTKCTGRLTPRLKLGSRQRPQRGTHLSTTNLNFRSHTEQLARRSA